MPVPKGTYNFGKSDRARMDKFIERLKSELEKLGQKKAIFTSQNLINSELAEKLGVNKSTLYTNVEYKALILTYLEQQPIRGTANSKASDSVKIAELEIELSNAKHEISVLRRYIEKLDQPTDPAPAKQALPSEDNLNFQKTAQALSLLLEATDGQFALQDGSILDMAKRVNNVVAQKNLVAPFLKWFESQENANG